MATVLRSTFDRMAFGRPVGVTDRDVVSARPATALVGRVLLSAIFVLAGIIKFANHDKTLGIMQSEGIPWAEGLLVISALAEIVGGLSILTGTLTRLGAIGLFVYLIPVTLIFHDFWTKSGDEQSMQSANFMKNLAIMGGLLLLAAFGGGRHTVDAKELQKD